MSKGADGGGPEEAACMLQQQDDEDKKEVRSTDDDAASAGKEEEEEATATLNYDRALELCGHFGAWQWRTVALCSLLWMSSGLDVMSWSFTAFSMRHRCRVPACEDGDDIDVVSFEGRFDDLLPKDGMCQYYHWDDDDDGDCRTYAAAVRSANNASGNLEVRTCAHEDLVLDSSVVTSSLSVDYGLTCDRLHVRTLLGTTYMLGLLIGSVVMGYVSDRFGRKPASVVSLLVLVAGGVAGAAAPDWQTHALARVVCGFGGMSIFMCSFVLVVETAGPRYVGSLAAGASIPYAMGALLLGLEAYFVRDWLHLQLTAFVPLLALLVVFPFLDESPRWLLVKGRKEEARAVLRKIASANGREDPLSADSGVELEDHREEATTNIGDLLVRSPRLRCRLLNMAYQWSSVAMCFYGLTFASTSLSGDPYLNFTLSIFVEIPGCLFVAAIMDCWGRRPVLVFLQLLPGAACIAAGLMHGDESLAAAQTACSLIGKFGASGCFSLVYAYTAELFPTPARSSSIGFCSMTARFGCGLSLALESLALVWGPMPMVLLGSTTLAAGVAALALPETGDRPVTDTVEEAEAMGRKGGRSMCDCDLGRCPILGGGGGGGTQED